MSRRVRLSHLDMKTSEFGPWRKSDTDWGNVRHRGVRADEDRHHSTSANAPLRTLLLSKWRKDRASSTYGSSTLAPFPLSRASAIHASASAPAAIFSGADGSVTARQIASATSDAWVIGPELSRMVVMKR
jgi:hypothetical protein